MDPASTGCPHLACPARGPTGQGNLGLQSRKEPRCLCTEGRKTCTATKGPAWYRLRTAAETVSLVVTRMAHGCPRQAIVGACGDDERTVAWWLARAGVQGQAVQAQLVAPARDLGQGQADDIRVKTQGASVGMA
jgi:IS5 family transposase